mgnify:CR=1 FL=1
MTDARHIEAQIYERLNKVIDPELGRSITDLGMIAAINAVGVTSQAEVTQAVDTLLSHGVDCACGTYGRGLSAVADHHQSDQRRNRLISRREAHPAHRGLIHEP